MYHSVSDDPEAELHPYYRLATRPERFAQQMQWLKELGCQGLSLEEALPLIATGENADRRLVALTFDDGFRDFFQVAWPVLRRHQFTATVYLPTGCIGAQRGSFRGRECLTWDEVRELRAAGIHFGSHTVSHPVLHQLPWQVIERELSVSKAHLEEELREEILDFAYPYGFPQEDGPFIRGLTELLRGRGYRSCVTTMVGRARAGDDPLCLKRLPVNSADDLALFQAKLEGAYDWLSWAQAATRYLKRWRGAGKSITQRCQ